MQSSEIGPHISSRFDNELEDIRNEVLAMGRLVERQIALAVRSFVNHDVKLAERVIQQEQQVDRYEVDIDEKCVQVHALRQPTAFDLRLLFAIVKTIAELEKTGDLAASIASAAMHLADIERKYMAAAHNEVLCLADLVQEMLHGALDAFERMDEKGVPALACRNDEVDREYVDILRKLTEQMIAEPHDIKRIVHIMAAVRAMEAIGEHAANICYYVIYIVSGKDIRHLSPVEMLEAIQNAEDKSKP